MTTSWPFSRLQVFDASGRPYIAPRVYFYEASTTTPFPVYADAFLSSPLPQPVVADGFGRFPRVFLPAGQYREVVQAPDGSMLWNDDGLGLPVVDDTTDPTTPIDPSQLIDTGFVSWRMDGAIRPGWVRMNTRTIGNAASGASEFAGPGASALFAYLWQNFSDAITPVVGGRGVSAGADFAAGKQIVIPTMQGIVAGGLDDMGSTPANIMQVTTALLLIAGSTAATVGDPSRLAIGMTINAPGVPANTAIIGMSGTAIVMSNPAGAGSSGTVTARFSIFSDAQVPGALGGRIAEVLTVDQLPTFTPSGGIDPVPPHQHQVGSHRDTGYGGGAALGATNTVGQGSFTDTGLTELGGAHTPVFRGDPIGHSVAHSNVQPTRLGTYYLKL